MKRRRKQYLKGSVALLLVMSMILGSNISAFAAEENKIVKDAAQTSLNNGEFKVSLDTTQMHPYSGSGSETLDNPEILEIDEGYEDVQFTLAGKYVGEKAGVNFTLGRDNADALKKDTDFTVSYSFAEYVTGEEAPEDEPVSEDYVTDREGLVTLTITGTGAYTGTVNLAYFVENKSVVISADSITLAPSKESIRITNNTDSALYVYAIKEDLPEDQRESQYGEGITVYPKSDTCLYQYYEYTAPASEEEDEQFSETHFEEGKEYSICVSTEKVFSPAEGHSEMFVFTTGGEESDATTADYGQVINFKAYVKPSTQTVCLSWKPAKKLGYKFFELKRLNKEGSDFETVDGWNGRQKKKAFNTKIEKGESPAVFKLDCYKKKSSDKPDGEYITVAAPSLFYVETGREPEDGDYCFSKLCPSDGLSYILEMSTVKNFESRDYNSVPCDEVIEAGDYQVKKNLSVPAVMALFDSSYSEGDVTYYQRVRSVYDYKGKTFESVPSNVITRKAGLQRVDIFNINGIRDPSLMNRYLSEMMANASEVEGEYDFPAVSSMLEGFVHEHNEGADAKHGFIVFVAPKAENLKSYELLSSDSENGRYKSLKTYKLDKSGNPAQNSGLYEWDYNGFEKIGDNSEKSYDWLRNDGLRVFYAQYNEFNPGTVKCYAVRAVSGNGAVSGVDDGYEYETEADDVWNSTAFKTDNDKNAEVYWTHDECPVSYRIFRGKTDTEKEEFDINDYDLVATVKNTKAGTLDRNNPKETEKELVANSDEFFTGDYNKYIDKELPDSKADYDYVIVPVTDTESQENDLDKAGYASTFVFNAYKEPAAEATEQIGLMAKSNKQSINVSVKGKVKHASSGLAQLEWRPSSTSMGGIFYQIDCRTKSGSKFSSWSKLVSGLVRTDYLDKKTLKRGIIKQYRVTPYIKDSENKIVYGKATIIGEISFPSKIEVTVGRSTIVKGHTTTIKVYPKRLHKPTFATEEEINVISGNKRVLEVVNKKYIKGSHYWLVTVKGVSPGTSALRMEGKKYSGASGTVPYMKVNIIVKKK
jgi:hypothetical protein